MVALDEIKQIVGEVLQIGDRVDEFDESTMLLGSVPEFDSMAVVMVITALEENYGITVDDDEVSAEVFETVGALQQFVSEKVDS
ncbi:MULTISPECIES: acyl carrier protein [Neptunomonas]|uniref:Acyl carrier protein n=1 Tax=Neptunomonas marina TaxID=1815562 RepID=A0A437Q8S8_9GAMM|nr:MULTISPECIES: phosphopantetheine-binding protein [Neptunomonas]RVU30743.1 acyl carrier protein [Neptunomonas marina]